MLLQGDVPCPLNPSRGCLHHTIGSLIQVIGIRVIVVLGMLPGPSISRDIRRKTNNES